MTTRSDRRRPVEDESRAARSDPHQGFVRSRDVRDTKSQAAAPPRARHGLDRSGERQYEAELQRFERQHDGAAAERDDQLEDAQIRQALRDRFAEDPDLADADIDVAVDGALVILSGRVASAALRRRAEHLVLSTAGVDDVRNQIAVIGDV